MIYFTLARVNYFDLLCIAFDKRRAQRYEKRIKIGNLTEKFMEKINIGIKEVTEKILTVLNFTKPESEERKWNLNGIRFLIGDKMFEAALASALKVHKDLK